MEVEIKQNIDVAESEDEVKLILERYEEAKSGKVKTIDESMKEFINSREVWKNLV